MAKKQYYAVLRGRKPGIYDQWTGADGAEAQVKGFPGALFKGFPTRAEAERFMQTGGVEALTRPIARPLPGMQEAPAMPEGWDDYKKDLAQGKVVIFTDGASTGNPGPGGYGVVMLYGARRKELSGGFRCTTNNRMELTAVIAALQALKKPAQVVLYADSRYVVDGVEKGWARRWKARGWMRSANVQAENADLWAVLLDLLDRHKVELRWVRGHARHPENERCDQLAVQAAHGRGLPDDAGYTGAC